MDPTTKGRRLVATHYFIYFGVMGLFLPFFNLYCYHVGLSEVQIGVVSATRSLVLIVFSICWSLLADRLDIQRPVYILCNGASAVLWTLFMVSADFHWILISTILYGIFYAPIIAFLESFAMAYLGGEKKSYGLMRVWGSLSFITVVLVLGRAVDRYGVGIILWLILAGSCGQALVSFGFPKVPAQGRAIHSRSWRFLARPRLVVFWCAAFLMLLSHGAYYAFYSIHLDQLGYGAGFIGLCWALASAAEVLVMLKSQALFKRFSYESILVVALCAAVCRWAVSAWSTSAWILLSLQLLHCLSYGAFHMASILYTDHWAPEGTKTLAQAVNNAVTYGLGLMIGFFISGAVYQRLGAATMFGLSAIFALMGGLLFGGFIWRAKAQRQG